jgi:5-(carboxyamino)imidazole ribonucleotide mutase
MEGKAMARKGPKVGVLMGSKSDWETMKSAVETLESLGIACEVRVLSAHRTPQALLEFVRQGEKAGISVLIAGAGGAAHLAGVIAAHTTKPVLGVPLDSSALKGLDALLATVQMPAGVPVATFAIGKAGATNAALFAAEILALTDKKVHAALLRFRESQAQKVRAAGDPRKSPR